MKVVLIYSGGLDSTVLAYWLRAQGADLHLLSFDYGQRHKVELRHAATVARLLGADWQLLDLSGLRVLLPGSALTDDVPVPDGDYEAANMVVTVVPNRNAIMLAIAAGHAAAIGADEVYTAVHAGDHAIYADCRPEFVDAMNAMLAVSLGGKVQVRAPFVTWFKEDIVAEGARLGVPFEQTWSCYKGGLAHCGTCGTCTERKEAFDLAGVDDPTLYLT